MPYIAQEDRARLDPFVDELAAEVNTVGELNYAITMLAHLFLPRFGLRYKNLNEVVGVLDCAKQEFYRRAVVPFENEKIAENGDLPK